SEPVLFEKAFGGAGFESPITPQGSPIPCDDIFELGVEVAAYAVLAMALTGPSLSGASRTTLLHVYNALSPRKRGRYKLTLVQRARGRSQKTEYQTSMEQIDDRLT